jgi:hypothetical protein
VLKTILATLILSAAALPAVAQDAPASPTSLTASARGKMVIASDGARLAPVFRVASDGPQIILDGRMVTIPANTVSMAGGKLTTSLTKGQVIALP